MKEKEKKEQRHIGTVVSNKMEKTIVVKTSQRFEQARFKKILRKDKKYKVHDEKGVAKVGDIVEFYEGRPLSKEKFMYLDRVIKSAST